MKKLLLAAAVAGTFGLAAAPSFAQTPDDGLDGALTCDDTSCTDADMDVTVTIVAGCSDIEVGDLDFGTHVVKNEEIPQTTTLDVLCNTGTPYIIDLDYGLNPASADATLRQVTNADNGIFIDYRLFQDAARTIEWGTEAVEPGSGVEGTGTGAVETRTVYGSLRQLDTKPAGTYTDLVTATVNF